MSGEIDPAAGAATDVEDAPAESPSDEVFELGDPEQRSRRLADVLRAATLSARYYAERLVQLQTWNTLVEGFLAVSTASTVTAWSIWSDGTGQKIWTAIGAVVAVVTVLKPLFKLGDKIARTAKLASDWHEIAVDAKTLCLDVRVHGGFDTSRGRRSEEISARSARAEKQDDLRISPKLVAELRAYVDGQYPKEWFWRPVSGAEGLRDGAEKKENDPKIGEKNGQAEKRG